MSDLPLYQIVGYDEHFENFKSRTVDKCAFVCVPNKHGGTGLSNVLGESDGAAIYGVWILILQICSRQRKPRSGWLTHDGKKDGRRLSVRELSNQLRRPAEEIHRCLEVVSSPEVGFMRIVDAKPERIPQDNDENTAVSDQYPPGISNSDAEGRKERRNSISKEGEQKADIAASDQYPSTDTAVSDQSPEADTVDHAGAKTILAKIARKRWPDEEPGAIWDNQLERLLADQVPLKRSVLEKIEWGYSLPRDHELFDEKKGRMVPVESFAALISNGLRKEASKITSARSRLGLNGLHGDSADREQSNGWTEDRISKFKKIFGGDRELPARFDDCGASVRRQIDEQDLTESKTHKVSEEK